MSPRAKLLTKIFEQGFRTPDWRHQQPPPVVSLEEFFNGNTQPASIAPNLEGELGLDFFYERLKVIRSREDVRAVLINIYDLSDIVFDVPNGWPMAENIHVLTSAPKSIVEQWVEELRCDGVVEGWPYGQSPLAPPAPDGFKWWAFAWD